MQLFYERTIFSSSATAWLYGKFKSVEIIDFWIYKHSRHPQYLGFLLWSYGLLMWTYFLPVAKGGYVPYPSLIWLVCALVMVGVCAHEEGAMVRKYSDKYMKYRQIAPFLLPLPAWLSSLITIPARLLVKKNLPESGWEIAKVLVAYGILLILLSSLVVFLIDVP